ncbi:mannose-6-phosphate isomerase, class I [Seonamhaeicola maritimus]|uniref:mannose-6-phosphate isomerase n=1 Tax=Seonamhaeicola maritimus TaxID=2591822 RepID=A0A5C7GKQ5_9FLAO|nr:mannose-6-phosphate isomerase, class I [Seonamhaeicola maritimus]TXG39059.1 mannose-6-phosphate isomerase, class I [Seonamhaeicola maritimus]
MTKIFALKGKIQNYAWGGNEYIPNLLGISKEDKKYAEYWMGAHVNAPSVIQSAEGDVNLDAFLNHHLEESLGVKVKSTFGKLPFLFKVLDVNDMLSIQVHPTKIEAEKGFKHENELGIPLSAPHRNYKDDNHKPEIMVALSEFWLLHGFLSEEKITKVLSTVPEFSELLHVFNEKGYYGLYKTVMEQSQEETNHVLKPLAERILPLYKRGELSKFDPGFWAAKAIENETGTSIDKGIYSIYFFNIVRVESGDAVFQDAGIPHAYLEGQNMELMANSDNVLRGGLTPKHIDVQELLKHVAFKETIPNIIKGDNQSDGLERIYKSPAPDFELSQIKLNGQKPYVGNSKSAQILIVIDGRVNLSDESGATLQLNNGESAFIMAKCEYSISSNSSAVIYKATTPCN